VKIKGLIISLCILVSIGANGQGISVSFGYNGIEFPDTISLGDTINYSCWVVNKGDDVLAESILINTAGYSQSQGLMNTRTIGGQGPNFIFPNDSVQFTPGFLYEVVTQQNYLIGDNIVVIWPKVSTPVNQSTQYEYKNVYVKGSAIISASYELKNEVQFYPQPANTFLKLSTSKMVKSVQLFDLLGRTIESDIRLDQGSIDVTSISSGIYLVHVFFEDGTSIQEKLEIQH
jgi:hypothetical protein